MPSDNFDWPQLCLWKLDTDSLDAAACQSLTAELEQKLEQAAVTLDLSQVRFADTIGLALLIRANQRWPQRLKLANVQAVLRRCLARSPAELLPEILGPSETTGERLAEIDLVDLTRPDLVTVECLDSMNL